MNPQTSSLGWCYLPRVPWFPHMSSWNVETMFTGELTGHWACKGARAMTHGKMLWAHWFPTRVWVLHFSSDLSMSWGYSRAYWNPALHHFTQKQTQNKHIFLMVKMASFSQNQNTFLFGDLPETMLKDSMYLKKGDKPLTMLLSWAKLKPASVRAIRSEPFQDTSTKKHFLNSEQNCADHNICVMVTEKLPPIQGSSHTELILGQPPKLATVMGVVHSHLYKRLHMSFP